MTLEPDRAPSADHGGILAVHALWSAAGRLCLWAEDPTLPSHVASGRGRPARVPRPRSHPFASPVARLMAVLGAALATDAVSAGELTVLLPSGRRGPLASPELVREEPVPPEPVVGVAPWQVPVLAVEPGVAVDLLLAPPSSVRAGASLRYLGEVAKLACELTAAGRVLPSVSEEAGRHRARWRPVPEAADADRLAGLASAMPPVCRAEAVTHPAAPRSTGGTATLEGRSPSEVLGEALDALADAVARQALAGSSLLPRRRGRRPARPRAAVAWLSALTSPSPEVDAEPDDLMPLARALEAWRRSGAPPPGPVRSCFRLVPPPEPDAAGWDDEPPRAWRLELLLQGADDPSLLIPAADVWAVGGSLAMAAGVHIEHPQDRLLADLGRAVRMYPELERALGQRRPTALDLDTAEAHRFLVEAAPPLTQAGFGVLTPAWWRGRSSRVGLKLNASPAQSPGGSSPSRVGTEGLIDYQWQLAVGDDPLTAEELHELAELKLPLVQVRGRWVELDPDGLDRAITFLERQAPSGGGDAGPMGSAELLRTALGLDDPGAGLPVVAVEADGWVRDLLTAAAEQRVEQLGTPAGFHGRLRPYQERGVAWLAFLGGLGLGACLADDMGLGKTPTTLALLAAERAGTTRPGPTLLVCPMSLVGNWQREAERFTPELAVHVHHGAERLDGAELAEAVGQVDLVITTYALAARDQEALGAIEWGRLVLDEAQAIKNPAARQTQAVRALRAPRRVALTGTPVENRLSELWSIMEVCNPGLLGSAASFRTRFATPVERFGDDDAADLLKRLTGPFILRRVKTDRSIISDLPAKLEMKVYCNLTREQATLYQAVVDDMVAKVDASDGIERKGLVLATMMKLKQVCNHPAQLLADASGLTGRSGKLQRLEELLAEALAEGDRALVFTQFAEFGHQLRGHLVDRLGCEIGYLHGGVPKQGRDELVARFQGDHGPPVLLLSLKAGGTGLNLTAANHVIHFDRWWNPAVEDQATDRAFRIGQRRDVQVRKLVCVGTLEERIDQMISDKRGLAARIVGTGESWLTELSTSELRDVVALRAEAVAE
jgi:SNF2-related domain/SNF2 Helicase protein/Helicase conserved C-terminal domain